MAIGAGLLMATSAGAVITGSKHDLSPTGPGGGLATGNNPEDQLCIYCHTPHHSNTAVTDAPLWNHEVTATAAFTLYTSVTLDATTTQPNGVSRLCLSCHDGTVALDSFGGMAGTAGTIAGIGTGSGNVGTDLSNDHPISFVYDTALATADGELWDPATRAAGTGTIQSEWLFSGNSFECASCHDVHNGTGFNPMLNADNNGSGLCLTCHNK